MLFGDFFVFSKIIKNFNSKTGEPIIWLLAYVAFTAIVVMLGVEKGIEKFSKILTKACE